MISSTGSVASIFETAMAASLWLYPSETSAAMACPAPCAAGAVEVAPATSSRLMPSTKPLATLSFSSSTMRCASFGPTPAALVSALLSSAIGAPVTLQPDRLLKEGDKIELDELEFTVWETPGHTAGCLTYFCGDAIFTGDTLFVQSCGRTDMYSSDFMDMVDSLTRLRSIKTNYHMYPGHEQDGMLFDQYAWIDSLVARVRAAYGR